MRENFPNTLGLTYLAKSLGQVLTTTGAIRDWSWRLDLVLARRCEKCHSYVLFAALGETYRNSRDLPKCLTAPFVTSRSIGTQDEIDRRENRVSSQQKRHARRENSQEKRANHPTRFVLSPRSQKDWQTGHNHPRDGTSAKICRPTASENRNRIFR